MPTEEQINSAFTLDELSKLVSHCDRCILGASKTKDVPGKGDKKAEVLFIGEAPGKKEDLEGEPFIGAAGKFLTELLTGIGMKRSEVYIANVLKHRPPENRDPKPEEIAACWPYLKRQIEIISPKLIVFLGRHAMNRFFPELKISEVHGKTINREWNGKKQTFLTLYHPAAALYNGGMRETLTADFKQILKILKTIN